MRPGRKPKSNIVKLATGTDQTCRHREPVVLSLTGEPVRPKWLTGNARKIWEDKIEKYKARGQSIVGCEDLLASYCALEARLIEDFWQKKLMPPASLINAHRVYGNEFFDTPASQLVKSGDKKPDNPFSEHGI